MTETGNDNQGPQENKKAPEEKCNLCQCFRGLLCIVVKPFCWLRTFVKGNRDEILAISTALTVVVLFLQWRTLHATDDTLRLQGRAWIAPRAISLGGTSLKTKTDAADSIYVSYENVGKEPATKINSVLQTSALPGGDFRNERALKSAIKTTLNGLSCDLVEPSAKGNAVFPNSPGYSIGVTVDGETVKKVNAGGYYLLTVGCFVYETLKDTRRTKFCAIVTFKDEARTSTEIALCSEHNDAD